MTIMAFLRHFGPERHFKLFIKPSFSRMLGRAYEHDVNFASAFNMLGAIGASDNWPEIMGPTDISPYCVRDATSVMKCILEQGGLQGGVSMSFRVRREAIEPRDHFHAHILAIDTFARAWRKEVQLWKNVKSSFAKLDLHSRFPADMNTTRTCSTSMFTTNCLEDNVP